VRRIGCGRWGRLPRIRSGRREGDRSTVFGPLCKPWMRRRSDASRPRPETRADRSGCPGNGPGPSVVWFPSVPGARDEQSPAPPVVPRPDVSGHEEGRPCEAHVPTEGPSAGQEPRIPCPDVDPRRSIHPPEPSGQGSGQAVGLITRVRDRRTFVALRADGIRVRRGPLSITHLDDDPDGPTRLAFAITRRVGPAVVRNRLRRRLREICVELDRTRPALVPGGALLLVPGPDAVRRTPDEMRNDVIRLLDELHSRRQGR
jgi:ribonuclease P protein component